MNMHTLRMMAGLMAGALFTFQAAIACPPLGQDTPKVRQLLDTELAHALHGQRRLQAAFTQWADRTTNAQLKDLLQRQAVQAESNMDDLQQACMLLGRTSEEKPSLEFEGLLDDTENAVRNHQEPVDLDLALMLGALRAQQYVILTCTSLLNIAERTGEKDVAELFERVRDETEMADGELWNLYRSRLAQLARKPEE
jgi:ferritin-like metal-binding protein YciE